MTKYNALGYCFQLVDRSVPVDRSSDRSVDRSNIAERSIDRSTGADRSGNWSASSIILWGISSIMYFSVFSVFEKQPETLKFLENVLK